MHNPTQSDDIDCTELSSETSRELFPPMTTSLSVSQENVACQRSNDHDTNMSNMRLCTFREREEACVQRNRSISQEVNKGKTSHLNSISTTPALFMKCDSNRTSRLSGQSIVSAKCNFSSIKCLPQTPRQIRKVETRHTPSARYSSATSMANHYNHNNSGSNITSARSFKIVPTDAAAEAEPPLESPLGKVELEQKVSLSEELHHQHQQHEWEGEQNQRRPSYVDGFRCNSIMSDIRMRQSYSLPSTVMPFSSLKERIWNNKRYTTNTSTPATLPTLTYSNESNKIKIEGELWLINNNNDKNNIFNSGLLAYKPTPNRVKSMKLMNNRRQWVVCEDNRLLVYSSWSASYGKLIAEMSFHRVHVLFQFIHSERTKNCNNEINNFYSGDANNSESPFSNIMNKNTHRNTQMSSHHPSYAMHNNSSSQLVAANSWTRTSERANSINTTKQNKQRKEIFSTKSSKIVNSEIKSNNINKKRNFKSSSSSLPAATNTINTTQLEKYHKEEEKHEKQSFEQRKNDQYYEEEEEEELEQPRLSECKQITLTEYEPSNITKRTIEQSPFLSKYYSTSTQKCCDNTVSCNKYNGNRFKNSAVCRRSKINHNAINLRSYYYYFGVEGLTHEVTSSTNRRSLLIFCTDSWKAYTLWIRFWNEMTMRYPVITHLLTTSIHRSMSSPEPIPQDTSSFTLWEDDDAIRHSHGDNELKKNITCDNKYINNGDSRSNNDVAVCLYKNESNTELTKSNNEANVHNLVNEQLLDKEDKGLENLNSHEEQEKSKRLPEEIAKEHFELQQQEEEYELWVEERNIKLISCNDKIFLLAHGVQNEEEVDRLHVEVHEMCAWVMLLTLCHDSKQECRKNAMSTFMEEELIPKLTILFEKNSQQWIVLHEELENLTNINDTVARLTNEAIETLSFELEEERKTINKQLAMKNDYVKTTCVSFTSWNYKLTHMSSDVNVQDIAWSVILDQNIGKTHFVTSSEDYCNLRKLFQEMEVRLKTNDTFISEIIEHTLPLSLLEAEGTNLLKILIACNGKLRKAEIMHILNAFASSFNNFLCSAYAIKSQEIQIIQLQQEEIALRVELHAKEQEERITYVLHLQRESAELAVHLFSSIATLLNETEEQQQHEQQHELRENEEYLHTSCRELALKNNDNDCHLNETCVQTERCVYNEVQVQTASIGTVTERQKEEVESRRIKEQEEEKKLREEEESRLKELQHERVANLERENTELKTQLSKLQDALLVYEQECKTSESRNNHNINVLSGNSPNFQWKRKIVQLENAIAACENGISLHEKTTNQNIDTHEQEEEDVFFAHELSVLDRSDQIINALQDKYTQLTNEHINYKEQQQEEEWKEEEEHYLHEFYSTESMQTCAELMLDAKKHFMTSTFDNYRQLAELLYNTEVEQVIHAKCERNGTIHRKEELLEILQVNNNTLQQQIHNEQCDKLILEHRNNTFECVIEECKESEKLLQEHVNFLQKECNTLSTDLFRCNKEHREVLYKTESTLALARKENEANQSTYQSKLSEYHQFVKTVHNLTSQLAMSLGIVLNSQKREKALSAASKVNELGNDNVHLQYNDKSDSSAVFIDTTMELAECTENLSFVLAKVMERSGVDAEMHTELEKLYQFITSETSEKQLAKSEGAELLELYTKKSNFSCNNEISGPDNGSTEAMKLKIRTIYDTLKKETEHKHILECTLKELETRLSNIIGKIRTSDTVKTIKSEIEDVECASTAKTLSQEENAFNSITFKLDKTLNFLEHECDKLYAKAGKKDDTEHMPVSSTQLQIPQSHNLLPSEVSEPFPLTGKTPKLDAPEFDDECQLIAEICYMRRLVRKKVADDELTTVHINHLINMLNLCQSRDRQRSQYR